MLNSEFCFTTELKMTSRANDHSPLTVKKERREKPAERRRSLSQKNTKYTGGLFLTSRTKQKNKIQWHHIIFSEIKSVQAQKFLHQIKNKTGFVFNESRYHSPIIKKQKAGKDYFTHCLSLIKTMVRRSGRVGAVCNTAASAEWVRIPSPSQVTKMR